MEQLILTKVDAWAIIASVDERHNRVIGYYKDSNIADIDAKGAGWYGSDGNVVKEEVYTDSFGMLYEVKNLGRYTDVERDYRDTVMTYIKKKLTEEEQKFLGI